MAKKVVFSLLVLMVLRAAAQQVVKYFEVGGKLELDPKFSQTINSITWKHKGNLVAEYIKDAVPLEYLGDLKGRAEVDLANGTLTVSRLNKAEEGEFTVEINNQVLPVKFKAVGIRNLEEFPVEVIVRPLTCSSSAPNCTLTCGGDFKEAGDVQFSWSTGDKGKTISIFKETTEQVESFTCTVKNSFREKKSPAVDNPFKKQPDNTSLVVGIVVVIVAIVVIAFIVYIIKVKPKWVLNCLHGDSGPPAGTGKELSPMNSDPDHPPASRE